MDPRLRIEEDPVEDRIMDVEIKLAFLEHHTAQLDEMLRAALDRLEAMEAELSALREQGGSASERGTLAEEVPPHHVRQ
jgi:uncharacterized coiled-coil protein SlyX